MISRRKLAAGLAVAPVAVAAPAAAAPVESSPGVLDYDTQFGTVAALNTWMGAQGSSVARPAVAFGTATRTLDTRIGLWSGHRLLATPGPAREFNTGAVWKTTQPSFFSQQANAQGYPSSTGVRDFYVRGVEFSGTVPVLPPHERTEGVTNNAVYYSEFRDCGFVGTPILKGWCDGLHLSGTWHVNGMSDTWLTTGGSILMLAMGGGMAYMDSNKPAWLTAGKPFIETWCTQWSIGTVEISSRQTSYGLLVSGGGNGRCVGTFFDAPDSNPTQGAAVRVTGGTALSFTGCSFHNNRGLSLTGGTGDVVVEGNVFRNCPEILTVGGGFTGKVLLGLNAYDNAAKSVKVTSLSQIVCTDPRITITDLSGNVLRAGT